MCVYTHIYIYLCMCIYIYIYGCPCWSEEAVVASGGVQRVELIFQFQDYGAGSEYYIWRFKTKNCFVKWYLMNLRRFTNDHLIEKSFLCLMHIPGTHALFFLLSIVFTGITAPSAPTVALCSLWLAIGIHLFGVFSGQMGGSPLASMPTTATITTIVNGG